MKEETIEPYFKQDEFGRWSGVLLIDKPIGKTSHDIVDELRKKYQTRKVGHAGALDPFASGLLIILVGKAVKQSDKFLHLDKEYEAEILLGVETDSGDTEGQKIKFPKSEFQSLKNNEEEIKSINKVLSEFVGDYYQQVPIYSSVKVQGKKLRELARKYAKYKIQNSSTQIPKEAKKKDALSATTDEISNKIVQFFDENDVLKLELPLPVKKVEIKQLRITNYELRMWNDLEHKFSPALIENLSEEIKKNKFPVLKLFVSCSKGTYMRQLAIDIGEKLGTGAMLINLKRTRIGNLKIEDIDKKENINVVM